MRSTKRSQKLPDVDIKDYYALNIGAMWRGLRQESWAFWWLCIYFFFEYVRPQSLYPVLDILPWAQMALLLAIITVFNDKTVSWVSSGGNALLLLFLFLILLSSVFAFRPSLSWDKIDIIFNWVILYFLMITLINTEKRFVIFILLFFLANYKMSQYGFRFFLTSGYTSWGVSGSPGWFKDSADLGIEMCIFLPLSVAYILALREYWGKLKKLFFYFMPITAAITVIATTSRGAQLGVATIGVWFLLKSRGGIKAIISIIIVGWALYSILPDRMLQEFEAAGTDSTSQARLDLWAYGRQVAQESPLLGIGYENWRAYCGSNSTSSFYCLTTHNTYIHAMAELGYSGLFVYILIVIYIFKTNVGTRANAQRTENKLIYNLAHGLDGGMVGYLIATIFFTLLYYPLIYVQLGMTVALHQLSKISIAQKNAATAS